jgi:hypothetical protein
MPDSPIKILWDSTLLFVTLINLIYIPFKIGFSVEESGNHWWVDIICDIVPGIVIYFVKLGLRDRNSGQPEYCLL